MNSLNAASSINNNVFMCCFSFLIFATGCELDARQAANARNTLCRTLYGRLFTWLVNKINEILKSTQREKNLALLDFYGFELLEINSFEQFAINYSAEKIHQVKIELSMNSIILHLLNFRISFTTY